MELITSLGWIATLIIQLIILHRQEETQRNLKRLDQKFEREREARQLTIPTALARIDDIEGWLSKGLALPQKLNFVNFTKSLMSDLEAETKRKEFMVDYHLWLAEADKMFALALEYETELREAPGPITAPPDNVRPQDLPRELPTLVAMFRHSMARTIHGLITTKFSTDFITPEIDMRAFYVYSMGIRAAHRVRKQIANQGE